jgi:hypothetical protein
MLTASARSFTGRRDVQLAEHTARGFGARAAEEGQAHGSSREIGMSSWGSVPAKGKLYSCAECGEPLLFVGHRRLRLSPQEEGSLCGRMNAHAAASPGCACCGPPDCFDDVQACNCPAPSVVRRQDGIHCALCDGTVEWTACRPPAVLWRGWPQQCAATG